VREAASKGTSTFPLIVLFGVMLAFLMTFVFIALYNQQLDTLVDEQANALANELAQTAFASLSGGQALLDLPRDVGGSIYTIEVRENSIFVVEVTGGRRAGNEYYASVNATVVAENGDFSPGCRLYFMRSGDVIIVSASPITAPPWNFEQPATSTPPEFYYFAKENSKEATAIIAAYFYKFENIADYQWKNENSMIVRTDSSVLCVNGYENNDNTGLTENIWLIENSWIVLSVENFAGEIPENGWKNCPSVENAWKSGWLYSPSQALEHLRGRTWRRASDNATVTVPPSATIRAAAATTNVSTYPTWRVEWRSDSYYIIHYRVMPWWEEENLPGFIFQSNPKLSPVV
jgi:hypothetical protein